MLESLSIKLPVFTIKSVIFQNSFECLLLKTPQETKARSKLTTKGPRTAPVNVTRMSLSLAWNIILKSVTELVFTINGSEGNRDVVCGGVYC